MAVFGSRASQLPSISFDEFGQAYNSDGVSTLVMRVGGVEGNSNVYWVCIDHRITSIPTGYREYRFGSVYRNAYFRALDGRLSC